MSVTVIVPAHNEQEIIVDAVQAIFNQTVSPTQLILACDNCSDSTVTKAGELRAIYGDRLIVYETVANKNKKAGALNQVFERFEIGKYVLVMDADVILGSTAIELGVQSLEKDSSLGAVTSRAGIMEMQTKNCWEKLLYHLQKLEYSSFDSHRVETKGKIKCLQGMFTIFRTEALLEVPKYRRMQLGIISGVYLDNCLTEDYEISKILALKWKIAANLQIQAETDVPLSLKEIAIQRLRWNVGGMNALKLHGFTKTTTPDILNHGLFFIVALLQITVLGLSIALGALGISNSVVLLTLLGVADAVYRLKYLQNRTATDTLVRLLVLPEMFYGMFNMYLLVKSYYLFALGREPKWR